LVSEKLLLLGEVFLWIVHIYILLSSLFLFVFDNDCVTCHTGTYVIPSDDGEA